MEGGQVVAEGVERVSLLGADRFEVAERMERGQAVAEGVKRVSQLGADRFEVAERMEGGQVEAEVMFQEPVQEGSDRVTYKFPSPIQEITAKCESESPPSTPRLPSSATSTPTKSSSTPEAQTTAVQDPSKSSGKKIKKGFFKTMQGKLDSMM
eukprot:gene13258-19098_t